MRAVVYRGANDLRVETVPVPRIGANELLVQVALCGVCPTDIKKIHYGTVAPPRIFGHETAGTIVKIGATNHLISRLKVGDRVALHHHVPCLKCHYCRHRAFAQCETYKRTGITAGFEPAGGGFAEYVRVMDFVLPGVVKIPAKNSFEEGAMLEPVNTVLKAVKRLNLLRGDNVLVAGQGPIGLMFTKILQLRGINVLATDLLESRLKLAKKFGARHVLLASQLSTLNFQLDSAIIAVPSDDAVIQALELIRGAGQVLLFAHTKRASPQATGHGSQSKVQSPKSKVPSDAEDAGAVPSLAGAGEGGRRPDEGRGGKLINAPVEDRGSSAIHHPSSILHPPGLDFASICLDEKDLIGSYSSDFTIQDEVARLVFSRRLDVRPLITHRYPLEQTAAAIALAGNPTEQSLKIVIQQV